MIIFQPANSRWLAVPAAEGSVSVLTISTNRRLTCLVDGGDALASLQVNEYERTSLIATGVYSMPNCTRSPDPGGSANAMDGGWKLGRSPPGPAVTGIVETSGLTYRVIVASGSRKS